MANSPLPPTTARIVAAAAEIMGDPDPDDLAFLHTVLAQVGLPYREPGGRDYIRQSGRAHLVISAGHLLDPQTRQPIPLGIPYSAKPRLLMIHLCSQAVRSQSPEIEIASSMSAFMRELGLQVTGGKRGTVGRFKEQLNRLAAARMQLMFDMGDHGTVLNQAPMIQKFEVWFPSDARQRVLWPSTVTLSSEFFDSLKDHALPLDPRGVRALQHSARALDIYTWLTHRLPRVRGRTGDKVSWAALQGQFGGATSDPKHFRRLFNTALRQALAVYPDAKVEPVDGGLKLRRSAPPIRRRLVSVAKP